MAALNQVSTLEKGMFNRCFFGEVKVTSGIVFPLRIFPESTCGLSDFSLYGYMPSQGSLTMQMNCSSVPLPTHRYFVRQPSENHSELFLVSRKG